MNTDRQNLAQYYAKRAQTYEQVYAKPERQEDLAILRERVAEVARDHKILEIACGTGYWTAQLAPVAASVLATDLNPEVITIAQTKDLPANKVNFAIADAFDLPAGDSFTACFAGFWWSHVKRQEQEEYLKQLSARLGKDTLLVLLDNCYVEGSSTSIARTDADGNTFQIRNLPDGSRIEVIKNFPADSFLRKKLAASVKDIRIRRLEHYWMLTGRLK
ncbi:MAG: class I SAM-dependent methyltransferase [Pseudomonadota bacterium]